MSSVVHLFNIPVNDPVRFAKHLQDSGQRLFYPPDVKGWRGDKDWLSANLLLERQRLVQSLLKRKDNDYLLYVSSIAQKYAFQPKKNILGLVNLDAILSSKSLQILAINEKINFAKQHNNRQKIEYLMNHDNFQLK